MKANVTILLGLGLCALALAQDPKPQAEAKPAHPCLAVSPTSPEGRSGAGPIRTFFYYLESRDLSIKDIKGYYKKKESREAGESGREDHRHQQGKYFCAGERDAGDH